jgi:dihydropteroate synthase
MVEAGADILDLGARSTAPNTQAISGTQEAERIDEALKELDGTGFTISVDTMNPWVLDVCLKHEIHAVNDIAGFCSEAYVRRVADAGLPAIVMATDYQPGDAIGVAATHKALETVVQRCTAAGIDNYVLDPGIGLWTPFRSVDDDWELSRHFEEFLRYDRPLLAAVSRKSFIGNLLNKDPQERLSGSLAVTMTLLQKGAAMVRTHDVKETVDTVRVFERLVKGR